MRFRDSLLDADRVPQRALRPWLAELTYTCELPGGPPPDRLAKVQNNLALASLHILGPEAAMECCRRQIRFWFDAGDPRRVIQPFINHLRILRIKHENERLRTELKLLREMTLTGVGRINNYPPFELTDGDIQICGVNWIRETAHVFGQVGNQIGTAEYGSRDDIVSTSIQAMLADAELKCMDCYDNGSPLGIIEVERIDSYITESYARAVFCFYQAAFYAKWRKKSEKSVDILTSIIKKIEAASKKNHVDHRILRLATSANTVARAIGLFDLDVLTGHIVHVLADHLDDVRHKVHYFIEITNNPKIAQQIVRASGYTTIGTINVQRSDIVTSQINAALMVLDRLAYRH